MRLTSISPETRRIVPECPRSPNASHWKRTFPHFAPANNGSKKRKSGDNTYQTPEVTQLWSIGTWWLDNYVRRLPERSKKIGPIGRRSERLFEKLRVGAADDQEVMWSAGRGADAAPAGHTRQHLWPI